MFSYWEQQSFLNYDYIIIGLGIVGLSVGIELRTKHPTAKILILERGIMTSGASSRNAGFACIGSLTELLDDLNTTPQEAVLTLIQNRFRGLEKLRSRLGDDAIGYEADGSYELIEADRVEQMQQIDVMNQLLKDVLPHKPYSLANHKIASFGFATSNIKGIIENHLEGSIHTGKMLSALTQLAISLKIEIKTGATVTAFNETESAVSVTVPDPYRNSDWLFKAQKLFICTNAFTNQLLPNLDLKPGRGQVLITEPLPNIPFKGIFHMDGGYYYFRVIDNRILLGGGRHLDFQTETTCDFSLNEKIQESLDSLLHKTILPNTSVRIQQRWAGIMAFGSNKTPLVQNISSRIHLAVRMNGMGVAIGSNIAEDIVHKAFH